MPFAYFLRMNVVLKFMRPCVHFFRKSSFTNPSVYQYQILLQGFRRS